MRTRFLSHWSATCLMFLLTGPSQAGEPAKKLPIPGKAAQAKAMELIDSVFKEDFAAAKEPDAQVKLATYLLQQGRESKDEPANRYVLYREARNLAAKAGDAALALQAVDELARDFDLNLMDAKASTLAAVADSNLSKETGKALVDITLPLLQEALEADNHEAAAALGQVAEIAARKSKSLALVNSVQKRNEEVAAVRKGFARLQAFVDRLKMNPKDLEANLELGKYYGLLKNRWERALPLLAMGSDDGLKTLAVQDLARPKDAHQQLTLADGWWERSAQEQDPAQLSMRRRAMHWYEQAVGQLAGLNRTKALKRIDAVIARLVSSSSDGPSGPVGELKKFEGHAEEVKTVAFAPDGRYGASGGVDTTVRIWDLAAGKEERVLRGHGKQIWSVAFLPSSRQVVSASWDATARLWDVKQGSEVRRYSHRLDINGLAVSRDGNFLLTGSDDHNVYLWNIATGEEVRRFSGHTGFVYSVAFSPDGRHVASGSVDKTIRIFELATGSLVRVIEGHANPVANVVFAVDSRSLFSSGDNVAHQWAIASGKEQRRFEGHKGNVPGLALSPDGRRLLTGGDDKTIRFWDVATGKELHRFEGHGDTVNSLAFSSDGRRALSASLDRTVRLWGLPR